MAGYSPAPLPSLSLVFNADSVGSAAYPAPIPSIGLNLGPVTAYTGVSETGVFVLTGRAAGLRPGRYLAGAAGAFVLTGQDSTGTEGTYGSMEFPAPLPHLSLVLTGVSGLYLMPGQPGAFVLSGQAATLRKGIGVTAETGVFVLSGAPAERDMEMNGDVGAFTITGVDAGLVIGRPNLTGEAGAFVLTGNAASLSYDGVNKSMAGFFGTFTLTGQDSGYTYTRALQCGTGTFTLTGQDAGYETTGTWEPPPQPEVSGEGWRGAGGELVGKKRDDEPWWLNLPTKPLPKKVERAIEVAAKVEPAKSPLILVKKLERAGVAWEPDYAVLLSVMQERDAESMADLRGQVSAAILAARRGEEQVVSRRRQKILDAAIAQENDELLVLIAL